MYKRGYELNLQFNPTNVPCFTKFRTDSTSLDLWLTLVDSGNSPQVHCMWDSALSMLSAGFTISSESLLGDMGSDISLL